MSSGAAGRRLVALAAFALIVVVVVAADRDTLPAWIRWFYTWPGGDKLGHFVLMGALSFVVQRAVDRGAGRRGAAVLLSPGPLVVAALVALEEWSQLAFRSRSASWIDLAASLAGIACGAWLGARRRPPSA